MGAGTQIEAAQPSQKKWMTWTGRALSAVPVLFMLMGLVTAFLQPQAAATGMAHFGYAPDRMPIVLTLEVTGMVLYLIPQTVVFGAIFMTAYFGGAVATHVRIHDPGWPLAVVGAVCAWIGLYLREERLRPLVPLRRLGRS
jgi:DoxX-like family